MKEIDCAFVEQHDWVSRYLSGTLSETEANQFEAHYFGCDRCSGEVQTAAKLRAAFGHPAIVRRSAGASRRVASGEAVALLAAAAAVAMVALGMRQLARPPVPASESTVFRGESVDTIDLSVTPGSGSRVILQWSPDSDARSYRVEVLRTDGVPVLKSETRDNRIELDLSSLPARPPGVSFLVRIDVLGPLGAVVARSEATPLP